MNESQENPRVAILGGSFDPVHRGHLAMAETVRSGCGMDRILFLPCFVSPHKAGTVADSDQRLDMLRLALEDQPIPGSRISRFEIDREEPSYSWETASAFSRETPGVNWFWILGTDQWNALHRWARPDVLRELLHFVVCTRGDEELAERIGWRRTVVEFSHPASSTAIRRDFPAHRDWLTPRVAAYCEAAHLYSRD